jgi:hypothetical protein
MRPVLVYLTVLVLLALSLGVGYIASDWPHWCARVVHGCPADWLPRR